MFGSATFTTQISCEIECADSSRLNCATVRENASLVPSGDQAGAVSMSNWPELVVPSSNGPMGVGVPLPSVLVMKI